MSELFAALLDNSLADVDLLTKNEELGDIASIPRQVDFYLVAPDRKRAELVANFMLDNRYGEAKVHSTDERHQVVVSVVMPTTENVLCSVSGLMECIAAIFELEYDGWAGDICSVPF